MIQIKRGVSILCFVLGFGSENSSSAGSATFTFDDDPRDLVSVSSTQMDVLWSEDGEWAGTGNPGGFLSLTEANENQSTVFILPDIDDGFGSSIFKFKMDVRMGNGTSNRPADGFSLSYARVDDPVFDGEFALPGPPENGTRTGIVVSFDTWEGNTLTDGSEDVEGIIVVVDGKSVRKTPMPTRHGECEDITSLQTGPQGGEGADVMLGDPSSLCWAPLEMELDHDGLLTVIWKRHKVLDRFKTHFSPTPGRFVLAGRTGGANQLVHIDNIEINTALDGHSPTLVQPDCFRIQGLTVSVDHVEVLLGDDCWQHTDLGLLAFQLDGERIPIARVTRRGDARLVEFQTADRFLPGSEHVLSLARFDYQISFSAPQYVLVEPQHAVAGDFENSGSTMRIVHSPAKVERVAAERERHLLGELVDSSGARLTNLVDAVGAVNGDTWELEGVVNYSLNGRPSGVFRTSGDGGLTDVADTRLPGLSGPFESSTSLTIELAAVVGIPEPGLYRFVFNSNGSFQTSLRGSDGATEGVIIGAFDGGRAMGSTYSSIYFEEAGFYEFRTIWYDHGRGANFEWWTADEQGRPIALLNDDANGGLRTYQPHLSQGGGGIHGISRTPTGSVLIDYMGTLESSDVVAGPYVPVMGATSPFEVTHEFTQQFFIAR